MTPVACDVWQGFIFINVDPHPQESLRDYLGGLARGLDGYPFETLSATCRSWTTEVKANWKVLKDAFQEVYHLNFLHIRSLADLTKSKENPYGHFLDVRLHGRHGSASVFGNKNMQPTPLAALAFRHGTFLTRPDFEATGRQSGVNPLGHKDWINDLNIIFPCFDVFVSENSYLTHNFWPIAVDRTVWQATQYFPKAETAGQRFMQEYGHVLVRDILLEDGSTLEEIQSMLRSGAKAEFPLQDQEILLRQSHYVVQQMLNGQPVEGAN